MKKSIKIMAIICSVIAVLVLFSAGRDLLIANGILPLPESKNELSVTNKYFLGSLDGYIIVLRFDDEEILHMAKCDPLTKKVTDTALGSYSQDNRKVYITTNSESVYILSEDGTELVCGTEKYKVVDTDDLWDGTAAALE